MKITGYEVDGDVHIARVEGDALVPMGSIDAFWENPQDARQAGDLVSRASVALRPAIPRCGKVVCIGLNYKEHAREAGFDIPIIPQVFSRWTETLISDGDPSPITGATNDWEAELGVVIGQEIRGATLETAENAVFGYCTFNDLTDRSLQFEAPQWVLGKNIDASGPVGNIVTADEVGHPAQGWRVTCHVNGEKVQDGNTSDFIFSVPELIAFVSRSMTLNPGDLIITGTPAGVGAGMKPPRFLKPGDTVTVEVEGLGSISTPMVSR